MWLERMDYTDANLHVTEEEWDIIKNMVQYAVDNYDDTNLEYLIQEPAEKRYERFVQMHESLKWEDEFPVYLNIAYLDMLQLVFCELEDKDVPNVNPETKERLRREFLSYNLRDFFENPQENDNEPDDNETEKTQKRHRDFRVLG